MIPPGESAENVLATAATAGFTPSRAQLARAHRAGLVPAPKQVALGYGKGTRSVYPVGTGEQFLRLCELKVRHRKFDALAWILWWEGWDVDPERVRGILADVASRWADHWSVILKPDGTLTEEAEDFLDDAHAVTLPSKTLRRIRRRAGAENFGMVLEGVLRTMAGHELPSDTADEIAQAMGLDLAQTDSLPGSGPWIEGDPLEGLPIANLFMAPDVMSDAVTTMTVEELRRATDMARGLNEVFELLGDLLARTLGPWALGFGLLTAMADDANDDVGGQALMVLFLHGLTSAGLNPHAQDLIESAPDLHGALQGLDLLEDLAAHVPEAATVLTKRRIINVMRNPAERGAFDADIAALRDGHPEEVAAALERQGLSPSPTSGGTTPAV